MGAATIVSYVLTEIIHRGATRPPMIIGVPLIVAAPMVFLSMVTIIIGIFSGWYLIVVLVAVIGAYVFYTCKAITKKDDQRLYQCLLRMRLVFKLKCFNGLPARYGVPPLSGSVISSGAYRIDALQRNR